MRGYRWAPWALVVWTVVVWVTRLRNADGSAGAVALSVLFLVLAAAVVATRAHALPVVVLAGLTVVVWLIRLPMILVADHGAGFKVVHAVIAAVSIGLAGLNAKR